MKRSNGSRHIVEFALYTSPGQEKVLDRIFGLAGSAYRELGNMVRHDLNRMELEGQYSKKRKLYRKASKEEKEQLGDELNRLRAEYRLRGSIDIEKHIPSVRQHYTCGRNGKDIPNYLPQPVCAVMAARLASGVEKILTGNGKKLSAKRVDTLTAKDNHTAIVFNPKDMTVMYSNVLTLDVRCPDTEYHQREISAMLDIWEGSGWTYRTEKDADGKMHRYKNISHGQNHICYCSIARRIVKDHGRRKYGYWLQVTLEGPSVGCPHAGLRMPKGKVAGLDPGLQTMAYYSDASQQMIMQSDGVTNIDEKVAVLQQRMDTSRRATNPERFDGKGRYIKDSVNAATGTKKWNRSACYNRLAMERRHLAQKRHDEVMIQYHRIANRIALNAETVYTEKMNYRALARRALRTQQKAEGDFKSKARFGASIGEHAPALFIAILKQKVEACGGQVICIPTSDLKASQYDPTDGSYRKHKLSERMLTLSDGRTVQRDMLSAFLLSCATPQLIKDEDNSKRTVYTYNKERISAHLDDAIDNIAALMDELSSDGRTYPTSVGLGGRTARPGFQKSGNCSVRPAVKGTAGETSSCKTGRHCGTEDNETDADSINPIRSVSLPPESPCL